LVRTLQNFEDTFEHLNEYFKPKNNKISKKQNNERRFDSCLETRTGIGIFNTYSTMFFCVCVCAEYKDLRSHENILEEK